MYVRPLEHDNNTLSPMVDDELLHYGGSRTAIRAIAATAATSCHFKKLTRAGIHRARTKREWRRDWGFRRASGPSRT
jgi:hypothetical protein